MPGAPAALLELPCLGDARGALSFLEAPRHVPFPIGSAFWWRPGMATPAGDGPDGRRAAAIVALRGRAEVVVDGTGSEAVIILDRADRLLLLPDGGSWSVRAHSPDAVLAGVAAAQGPRRFEAGGSPHVVTSRGMSSVDDCRLVDMPRIAGGGVPAVGALTEFEPFPIERLYWLFDVPAGQKRGSHAHKQLQQLIVAAGGSFEIRLDDGTTSRTVVLDSPDRALYVPRLIWRDLSAFSPDAVCLVVASMQYEQEDYLRDYAGYLQARSSAGGAA